MNVREWDQEIAVPEIQMTREEIKEKLREYEECYQLSSEQFHWQWKQGKAPDIPAFGSLIRLFRREERYTLLNLVSSSGTGLVCWSARKL
jgi:hypothetical protein